MNTKLNTNPKGEGQLRDLGLGVSIILKQILKTLFPTPSSNAVSKHLITVAIQLSKTHKQQTYTAATTTLSAVARNARSLDVTALKNVPVEMLRRQMCKWRTWQSDAVLEGKWRSRERSFVHYIYKNIAHNSHSIGKKTKGFQIICRH